MTYSTELFRLYRQALHLFWNMLFRAPEPFRGSAFKEPFACFDLIAKGTGFPLHRH